MNETDNIERDSFIFYRSFFEAIKKIENATDKANAYDAICELALNGNEIELMGIADIIFPLIKPQIVANNKRYRNGCKEKTNKNNAKAKDKQSESKTQANENENVNENENDNVNENNNWFDAFWKLYPKKVEKKKAMAKFKKMCKTEKQFNIIINGLKRHIKSEQWQKEHGKYVPYPTTWLNGERWNDEIEVKESGECEECYTEDEHGNKFDQFGNRIYK